MTWESALALLTQGIPFAITTVEATSAHMQAVMGFDRTRGTLLLRDPSQPYCLENYAEVFLEQSSSFLVPGAWFFFHGLKIIAIEQPTVAGQRALQRIPRYLTGPVGT